jgi:ferric-dicitrate binding protein FerR (iron transport regulator)
MHPEIKELLRKYRENSCTAEELARLSHYFSESKNETVIKKMIQSELESFEPPKNPLVKPDFNSIFHSIESSISKDVSNELPIEKTRKSKGTIRLILRIAAILIPAFMLGGVISYMVFNNPEVKEKITYHEIRTPLAARSEVILPDGSSIWLNAGSSIKYSNLFNRKNRDIILNGEGYFKVARNTDLPFNVKTGDLNIQAVGTEFNVKSYDDEGIIETTLVEGKIAIQQDRRNNKSIYLDSNQKAVYVKNNKKLTVEDLKAVRETKPEVLKLKKGIMYVAEHIDPAPIVAWKENRLILKSEELSNLLIKLERKYDVSFEFESESIKKFRFSGTLENETLTQVLDFIKLSAPIDYRLEGKKVFISENQQMTKKFSNHLKKK